jgi:2-(1,2-epoxy-1,2-dihydrophenyl)acetyl-CoA isomerase
MADLEVAIEDHIATLTMNRPEARNALSDEMRTLLCDTFHDLEVNDDVRCVVLRGAGDHFVAGGDIKSFVSMLEGQSPDELRKSFMYRIHKLHLIMFAMRRLPMPIIACVQGATAGAGVSLALCCDLVVAADNAFFTLAYSRIGVSPDGSSTYQLPRAVGVKRAMEMALLADRIDAFTALQWGLINKVVPAKELEAETLELATRLANGPTHAYGNTKALLYRSLQSDLADQLQAEAEAFADSASRPDFREGVTAFIEKRDARFTGE